VSALDVAIGRARSVLAPPVRVKRLCWGDATAARFKADASEHFVLGVAMEPTDGSDGEPIKPDTDNDVYSPEDVFRAAIWFMEHGRKKGFLHGARFGGYIMGPDDDRVVVLMSWVTPVEIPAGTYGERQDERIKAGTWLIAFRVNDKEIWAAVQRGEINGLSIGALARREMLEAA
jgi:hypothetical protein